MALNVISNFAANVAHRNLVQSDMNLTESLAKLSSGTRVVSAKDDAASMAIGSRLMAEVTDLRQARDFRPHRRRSLPEPIPRPTQSRTFLRSFCWTDTIL